MQHRHKHREISSVRAPDQERVERGEIGGGVEIERGAGCIVPARRQATRLGGGAMPRQAPHAEREGQGVGGRSSSAFVPRP